jgi:magnesium transporter
VNESANVDDTLRELRAQAAEGVEVLDIVFVNDRAGVVVGFVTLRSLLMSKADAPVTEVMHRNLVSVPPEMHQEDVARTFAKYDLNSIPVVDGDGKILGIITADDVIDVVEEEAIEDAHKMGAVEPMESSYLAVPFWTYFKKRAPWLLVLFVGGFFTTSAMEAFSPILRTLTQLAFYLPLLISAGGNSGSQSATMIIAGLAVDEIHTSDWWRVLRRELGQGLVLGLGLALIGALRVYVGGEGHGMALLIGTTLIAIVTLGCIVGSMMPLLLVRIGLDPATSSTPFIASLVDVLGIVVYLGLARLLLSGAMGLSGLAGLGG